MIARPYAEVIGDPIAHSKSPAIHNFWLQNLGIDSEYRLAHVRSDELAGYFEKRKADPLWRGCNITIPHKETAARIVVDRLPGYLDFGAINLVTSTQSGLMGGNTDVDGVVGPLNLFHDHEFQFGPVPKRSIAIIGAGGAARAAIAGLKALAFGKSWKILARRQDAAHALVCALEIDAEILPIAATSLAGVDILINASPLGMPGMASLALPLDQLGSGIGQPLIFEMVYAPLETELVCSARQRGYGVIDGLDMLVGQAVGAFHHLFGQSVPRAYISGARQAALSA